MTKPLQYITITLFALASVWMGCRNDSAPVIKIVYGLRDTLHVGCYVLDTIHGSSTDSVFYRKCIPVFNYGVDDIDADSLSKLRKVMGDVYVGRAGEPLYFENGIQGDGITPSSYTKEDAMRDYDTFVTHSRNSIYTDDSFRTGFAQFMAELRARGLKDSQIIFLGSYGTSDSASKTSARFAKLNDEAMRKQDSLKQK